jgi:hypothetical protein
MSAIEGLLNECGEQVIYATSGGHRVNPGNAYRTDTPRHELIWHNGIGTIYAVECDWEHLDGETGDVQHIDHHRPGDPGYGVPPAEFFRGSSLGQVIAELARLGVALDDLPDWEPVSCFAGEESDAIWFSTDPPGFFGTSGRIRLRGERHTARWSGARWVRTPQTIIFTAAADHCLGAAYAGKCPGVDVGALGEWRIAARAAHQGRSADEIRTDIESSMAALRAAPMVTLLDVADMPHTYDHDWSRSVCDGCNREPVVCRDMRDIHVSELPEAGTRLGESYIAIGLPGPDGRRKVVCSGTGEVVSAFLNNWAARNGLADCYGDPARGFAGGYYTKGSEMTPEQQP